MLGAGMDNQQFVENILRSRRTVFGGPPHPLPKVVSLFNTIVQKE